jgi:AcrR family transcriptional regulator
MGRHREFKLDDALDAALLVFWNKGYEGTSFSDLVEATNVARPGLYSAFGNKEELFYKVIERYEAVYLGFMREALQQPTTMEVLKAILFGCAKAHTLPSTPHGCLGVSGAVACSSEAEPIRAKLIARRAQGEKALKRRLKQAKLQGDLPKNLDPEALARYVMTVTQGMAIQAKAGATRKQLESIAELTLLCLHKDDE